MNKHNTIYIAVLAMMIFVIGGCAPVGPDYEKPESSLKNQWSSELEGGLLSKDDPETLASWWASLNDPVLTSLIERSIEGNLDVQIAKSRVRQARASRGIEKTGLFPTIDFSGSDTWKRSGLDGGTGKTDQLYSSSFDAGWEIDIFGGVRRAIESAQASLDASEADLYDSLVSLTAEVALNYVEVRTYQYKLQTVEENLQSQTETYQLTEWQSQAELSDDLAVKQAQYNLESTRSQIPSIKTGLAEAENRIAVLMGLQPGEIDEELNKSEPIPAIPTIVAVGVPADVIRRRPDVRSAERDLAAQTAEIGVATADLYPKFKLAGSISASGASFSRMSNRLLSVDDWTSSYGPSVSWAIFDAGAIRKNIEVQTELQEQALMKYESTILSAVEEVENALTAFVNEQERNSSLRKAVQAAKEAVELSEQEYKSGLIDFSNVLDAQRSLLSFESDLADSDGTVAANLITLYKTLGGGWESYAQQYSSLSGVNNEETK